MAINLQDRYLGAMLGLACGDAVGTSVEFSPRGSFKPVTDMTGGGPFGLKPGQWTDDTSMALCLAESLLTKGEFNPRDQMGRYNNWWNWGYLSSTGDCFDIGATVHDALLKFEMSDTPYCGSTDPQTAGNGSLMRLAPVVLFAYPDIAAAVNYAADSSRTTHGATEAVESCQLFAAILCEVLKGVGKNSLMDAILYSPTEPKLVEIAKGNFISKKEQDIKGSGYSVESLEAALWCFFNTQTYESAILKAANLGDDADTTSAIAGQIAGAYYGASQIPFSWKEKLAMREDIESMANNLFQRSQQLNGV
ncbi:MAG: ADP-ribosylglycohydrolase family protein [Pseudomonadota bacterium]